MHIHIYIYIYMSTTLRRVASQQHPSPSPGLRVCAGPACAANSGLRVVHTHGTQVPQFGTMRESQRMCSVRARALRALHACEYRGSDQLEVRSASHRCCRLRTASASPRAEGSAGPRCCLANVCNAPRTACLPGSPTQRLFPRAIVRTSCCGYLEPVGAYNDVDADARRHSVHARLLQKQLDMAIKVGHRVLTR